MGFFNFFGDNEHRVFNYKPVYYDKADEERKRRFGAVDGSQTKENYAPGSYLKGSFRDGHYSITKNHMRKTQTIIGIISMILIFAVLYFIAKFYQLL